MLGEVAGFGNRFPCPCCNGGGGVAAAAMNAPLPLPAAPLLLLLLAGCVSAGEGRWPTLAKRAAERDSGGPVCARCNSAAVVTPVPVPPPVPLPPGIDAGLAAIERDLTAAEAALPGRVEALRRAQAAARDRDETDDVSVEAEVQRTRFEAVLMPLGDWEDQLATLTETIAGAADAGAVAARIGALQDRINALRTVADGLR